jgi:glycosyltransferase involved in cell wall biosynthesis
MKKKILFVMNNLNCGGAEKALISLLQTINYTKYEVDLYLFKHEGVFLSQIPKEVFLLPEPAEYKFFDMSFKKAIIESLKMGRFDIIRARIAMTIIYKSKNSISIKEQKAWKYISNCIPKLKKKYDLAVGYLQRTPNYFCVDNTDAKVKVGFVHNDYEKLKMDSTIDAYYINKMQKVFTVSETCKEILIDFFPQFSNKFDVMYNIVSPKTIISLSNEDIKIDSNIKTIVTVGRLNKQKGYELAIEACSILKKRGLKFQWLVLGDGEERNGLELLISKFDVKDCFILKGIIENPYPYIKLASVYVQPSRFEGKSIAIDEAKILQKPIVVTNFSTAKDQITNEVNGLIVDMNALSLAEGILKMDVETDLKNKLISNLASEPMGNESEIEKIYEIVSF